MRPLSQAHGVRTLTHLWGGHNSTYDKHICVQGRPSPCEQNSGGTFSPGLGRPPTSGISVISCCVTSCSPPITFTVLAAAELWVLETSPHCSRWTLGRVTPGLTGETGSHGGRWGPSVVLWEENQATPPPPLSQGQGG